ncbi:MAG: OmpA family protein [Planctomycetes bacterium]|nr:OmpA family protein [Planctomycetota bacterium]
MNTEKTAGKRFLVAFIWLFIFGSITLGVVWYVKRDKEQLETDTGSPSQYQHTITVRADSFSGYCILRSTGMQNELKKDGIKLVIEDDQADYIDRMKALRKDVDMAVFTVDSFLAAGLSIGEFPATMVMAIDETKNADAIVAYKSAVGNLQDLNRSNARFVLTENSPSEFLARIVVADLNLPNLPKKWIIGAEGAEDVYQRFRKASTSEPRAYVLWEPYVSQALADPEVHILLGSKDVKGYIVDVLVAQREFLRDQPELVEKVVKAYLRSAYSYQSNMVALVIEDAKSLGENLKKEHAENVVKGIQWKNTLENYAHFRLLSRQESGGLENFEDIILKILRILTLTGVIDQEQADSINSSNLFYDKILENLQASNFHPGQKIGLIAGSTVELDAVRGEQELPALEDEEWDKLLPVGQMRVKDIAFRRGTAELNIQSKRDLEELAVSLKSMPRYYLVVVGNARAEGDPEANMLLAQDRAKVASEYLILRQGISRNRIRVIGAKPSARGGSAQSVTFELGQRPY